MARKAKASKKTTAAKTTVGKAAKARGKTPAAKVAKTAGRPAASKAGPKKFTQLVSPVEAVIRFVQSLSASDAADLVARAERAGAVVTLKASSVAFIDRFLVKKRARATAGTLSGMSLSGMSSDDPCPGNDKRCFKK